MLLPYVWGRFCGYLTYEVVRKVRWQMRCGLEGIESPYIEVDFAVTLRTGQYVSFIGVDFAVTVRTAL